MSDRLDARKNCRTGYACGSTCIPLSKECRKNARASVGRERIQRIRELARGEAREGRGLGRLRQAQAPALLEQLEQRRQGQQPAQERPEPTPGGRGQVRRSRPAEPVLFPKPLVGPSGARLLSYAWEWKWGVGVNREGDLVDRRESDWEKAIASAETGRNIVHRFAVEVEGEVREVSVETAARLLGYASKNDPALRQLATKAKAVARLRMAQAHLQQVVDDWQRDYAEVVRSLRSESAGTWQAQQITALMKARGWSDRDLRPGALPRLQSDLDKLNRRLRTAEAQLQALEADTPAPSAPGQLARAPGGGMTGRPRRTGTRGGLAVDPRTSTERQLDDLGQRLRQTGNELAADLDDWLARQEQLPPERRASPERIARTKRLREIAANSGDSWDRLRHAHKQAWEAYRRFEEESRRYEETAGDYVSDIEGHLGRDGAKAAYLNNLGLSPGDTPSASELKRAYRRVVKEVHPDTGGNAEAFRIVNESYEALKRMYRYDAYRAELTRLDRQCTTGHQCGNACIPKTKTCRKKAGGPVGEQRLKRISTLSGGSSAAAPAEAPEKPGRKRKTPGQAPAQAPAAEKPTRQRKAKPAPAEAPAAEPVAEKPARKRRTPRGGALAPLPAEQRESNRRKTRSLEQEFGGRELDDRGVDDYARRKVAQFMDLEHLKDTPSVRGLAAAHRFAHNVLEMDDKTAAKHFRMHQIGVLRTNALMALKRQTMLSSGESLPKLQAQLERAKKGTAKNKAQNIKRIERKINEVRAYLAKQKDLLQREIPRLKALSDDVQAGMARNLANDNIRRSAEFYRATLEGEEVVYGKTVAAARELQRQAGASVKVRSGQRHLGKHAGRVGVTGEGYARIFNEDEARDYIRNFLKGGTEAALGFEPGDTPSPAELKAAYRRAAAKAHPDAGGSNSEFLRVQNAYEDLKRRFNYDSLRRVRRRRRRVA